MEIPVIHQTEQKSGLNVAGHLICASMGQTKSCTERNPYIHHRQRNLHKYICQGYNRKAPLPGKMENQSHLHPLILIEKA
jgi:hypothetical protein